VAEWYESFFDDLAFAVWRGVVPAAVTQAETAFLLRHLGGGVGGGPRRLLDVPCGEGRLAVPLAAAGHEVVGVDRAAGAVERMRQEAAAAGTTVTGLVGDMRDLTAALDREAPFAGACCMGNSFGYLNSQDTTAFVEAVAAALAPGGLFVLDAAIAAEAVLPQLADHDRYEEGDAVLDTVNSYDPLQSTMITPLTLEAGGRREQRVVRHRVMTCREIAVILEAGGFDVGEVYGSLDDEPFVLGAERCLLVATRRR
jgi:SAM-dependent methyltransferase